MLEAQAFISLPIFLVEQAGKQFRTNLSATLRHCGITSWSEVITYLPRTYATSSSMRQALEYLRIIRQGETEVEEEYHEILNEVIFRCENVHRTDGKITV